MAACTARISGLIAAAKETAVSFGRRRGGSSHQSAGAAAGAPSTGQDPVAQLAGGALDTESYAAYLVVSDPTIPGLISAAHMAAASESTSDAELRELAAVLTQLAKVAGVAGPGSPDLVGRTGKQEPTISSKQVPPEPYKASERTTMNATSSQGRTLIWMSRITRQNIDNTII